MPIVHARHDDACVLVGDDGLVAHGAALDVAARLGELGDLVAAAVVDEELAGAHVASCLVVSLLQSRGMAASGS
jgi:hypothetical protein